MKRFLVSSLLLVSAFACTSSVEEPASAVPVIELDDAEPAPAALASPAALVAPAAKDEVADLIPAGAFANVTAFCAAQKTLAAPRIAATNERKKDEGMGFDPQSPMCREVPDVLAAANVDPFVDVKSVVVETGEGTAVYLLVNGAHGLRAIRSPFLSSYHDDPGCGSIERESEIKDIHEDGGVLVVTFESGRTYWKSEADNGELTLTYAQTCRAGAACALAAVVGAKAVLQREGDEPAKMRTFTTTYAVDASGAIVPAAAFDENKL